MRRFFTVTAHNFSDPKGRFVKAFTTEQEAESYAARCRADFPDAPVVYVVTEDED